MAELSTSPMPDAQLFRDAFNASPIGIGIENLDGHPLFVNPAFCRFLRFSEEELRSKHCVDFSPPEDAEQDWALFQQLKAGYIDHYQLDKRYYRKNGSLVWGRLSISLLNSRSSPLVIAIVHDITAQKAAEDAVRASEERLRLATQIGKMYAYDWDAVTDEVVRSPEAASMLGIPHQIHLTRQQLSERVHPEDRARWIAMVHEVTPNNPNTRLIYRVQRADGSEVWLEKNARAFFDNNGKLRRVIGMVADITERKGAERELALAHERLHLAMEAGGAGGWDFDPRTGRNVWFGKAHAQLGMTPDETEGSREEFWDRVHEDDRQRLKEAIRVAKDKHADFTEDFRVVWRDGTTRWLRSRGRFHHAGNGGPQRSLGISLDITDKRQAEEAIRRSEERLRLAQQAARIGTFELDVRTGRINWAEELESLYGLAPGSLEGKTIAFFKGLIHPADFQRAVHVIEKALKTGEPTECEWRAIWPDGSVHWIASRWRVLMDGSGEPLRVFGVNMDVTERKQAEQALHAHEELLKIFVKNVPAAVAMLDRDMRYLQVSDRWCTDYLPGRAQILGRSHYELFPDMPERWKEVHRRALAGETVRADEDHWDGQEGPHWARWEVRPWKTLEGTVGGILILAEDITRRKQLEEALSTMSRKLIESQEQERARIARELHDDINQRLALLSVDLESSRQSPPDTATDVSILLADLRERINEISSEVQSISHRLHSSQLEYLGIVAAARSLCREFSVSQHVEIDFNHDDIPRSVSSEVSLCLFRVLQEALHNAVKYSKVRHFEVRLNCSENQLCLTVSDHGVGFDPESALSSGGLGLTSMRERVRLINGTILIESKPTHGTTIRVRVPVTSEDGSGKLAV